MSRPAGFGLRYALGLIGWIIVLVDSAVAFLLPESVGFTFHSVAYLVILGIGLVLMFFFNTPGKNIFVNFGLGIWNTYNNVSGLVGDLLSYIRLFAIGLSGGILAMVFNQLAVGMSPDIPVVKQARDVADPAAGTRHQPLHVRSLVGGASAASDVRGVLQERRVRGRDARLHPVEKRIN